MLLRSEYGGAEPAGLLAGGGDRNGCGYYALVSAGWSDVISIDRRIGAIRCR